MPGPSSKASRSLAGSWRPQPRHHAAGRTCDRLRGSTRVAHLCEAGLADPQGYRRVLATRRWEESLTAAVLLAPAAEAQKALSCWCSLSIAVLVVAQGSARVQVSGF